MFGLQQGSAVLKEINREINLDMVEQLMSDTAEGVAYQKVRLISRSSLVVKEVR